MSLDKKKKIFLYLLNIYWRFSMYLCNMNYKITTFALLWAYYFGGHKKDIERKFVKHSINFNTKTNNLKTLRKPQDIEEVCQILCLSFFIIRSEPDTKHPHIGHLPWPPGRLYCFPKVTLPVQEAL